MNFSKTKFKYAIGVLCGASFIFFGYTAGCVTKAMPYSPPERTAWLVYWDAQNGVSESNASDKKYTSVSYFAAYFNEQDALFIPEGFQEEKAILKQPEFKPQYEYLTVVNDIAGKSKNSFKDINVVKRVLDGDAKRILHAYEIIELAQTYHCNGIDLDYEQIFKDPIAAEDYIKFIKILYDKASVHNIKLRVILEPSVKFSNYDFPKGPQYIVMFYNLYGLHSGPGPKADFSFIEATAERMKALPAPIGVAFSTGGCIWGDNGEKKFISGQAAKSLAQEQHASQKRDAKSDDLYFSFAKDNVNYTVWYADQDTLESWEKKAAALGLHSVSIWRLGNS